MKNKNTINNKKEKNTMTYNLKNTKINFVSAEDGKVFLGYVENGVRKEKGSENPIILADIMTKLGFEDTVMGSSSMDFASEYGFKKDGDAKKIYQNAINLI
tara:strand:+ start:1231 stop:1533 length:303 start_codon:yes stop_codon:yes gene_type:complete